MGPSCHLCAAVARPSLAGYRLEPPSLAPASPANRISSRRHCIPATLKRIRFSRCENDAFLPRPLLPLGGRSRHYARRHTGPTDPLITLLPHYRCRDGQAMPCPCDTHSAACCRWLCKINSAMIGISANIFPHYYKTYEPKYDSMFY